MHNNSINIQSDNMVNTQVYYHEHQLWIILQSIVFIILGSSPIVLIYLSNTVPALNTLNLELILGLLLIIYGIVSLTTNEMSFSEKWTSLSSLASLLIGGLIIIGIFTPMLTIDKLMFAYLSLKALSEMALTLKYRSSHAWILFFVSGIITMLFAVSVFVSFPSDSVHYYIVVTGVNILTHIIALLGLMLATIKPSLNSP